MRWQAAARTFLTLIRINKSGLIPAEIVWIAGPQSNIIQLPRPRKCSRLRAGTKRKSPIRSFSFDLLKYPILRPRHCAALSGFQFLSAGVKMFPATCLVTQAFTAIERLAPGLIVIRIFLTRIRWAPWQLFQVIWRACPSGAFRLCLEAKHTGRKTWDEPLPLFRGRLEGVTWWNRTVLISSF